MLIVHVPPRLPGTAWQIDGRYLKRAGDELTGLSDAELKAMFAETGPDFSAADCTGALISDLSPAASGAQMEEFRQVLPALSRSRIQVLLRELRKEGSIHSAGLTRAARWYPSVGREELQP